MAAALFVLHAVGGCNIVGVGGRSSLIIGQQVAVLAISGIQIPLAALFGGAVIKQGGLLAINDGGVHHSVLAVGGASLSASPHNIADLDVLCIVGIHGFAVLSGRRTEGDHGVAQLCQNISVLHAGPAAGAAGVLPRSQGFLKADGVAGVGVLIPVQGGLDDGILCGIRALGVQAVGGSHHDVAACGDLHRLVTGGPLGGGVSVFFIGVGFRVQCVQHSGLAAVGGVSSAGHAVDLSAVCSYDLLDDGVQSCAAYALSLIRGLKADSGDGVTLHGDSCGDDAAKAVALAGQGGARRRRCSGGAGCGTAAGCKAQCQTAREDQGYCSFHTLFSPSFSSF